MCYIIYYSSTYIFWHCSFVVLHSFSLKYQALYIGYYDIIFFLFHVVIRYVTETSSGATYLSISISYILGAPNGPICKYTYTTLSNVITSLYKLTTGGGLTTLIKLTSSTTRNNRSPPPLHHLESDWQTI